MKARTKKFGTRAVAMLLSAMTAFSTFPVSAGAAQVNSYHDPAEHWMQASGRTNELDVNAVVTHETFNCGVCGKAGVPDSGVYEGRPDCYEPECEIFGRYDGRRLGYGHDLGWRSRSERELYGLSLDESSM